MIIVRSDTNARVCILVRILRGHSFGDAHCAKVNVKYATFYISPDLWDYSRKVVTSAILTTRLHSSDIIKIYCCCTVYTLERGCKEDVVTVMYIPYNII